MRRLTTHLAVGGFFGALLLQCSSVAARGGQDCPGPDPARLETYDFMIAADSLVRPSSDATSYQFIRCVANEDSSGSLVYIDWPLANIKGWSRSDQALFQSYGSNTGESDTIRSTLYLGITRESMFAELRRSKAEIPPFQRFLDAIGRILVNQFITLTPKDMDFPDETARQVDLLLTSEVERLANTYRYTYFWQDRSGEGSVRFLWHSETMGGRLNEPADTFTATEEGEEYSIEDEHGPAYGLTVIELLDEKNRPAASAPVAIYHPERGKP